ncbi:RYamide receptor-like isoform X2 [Dermacentor andersoni]|uniref:RYamide receptor-like isoform X2 n=1 Tax=Dermacentor andersoni TaxID=34620 RepID=UPI002415AD9B|nr:RYamide receptor-like isoform X2 [Dermacentor andersoni]
MSTESELSSSVEEASASSNWSGGNGSEAAASCDVSPQVPEGIQALMYLMYIAVSVAAIGGNGIVCYIVIAYQRMRTVTNMFIMNLAIGDILMACLCIPFTFVSNLLLGYWPFGGVMCVLVTYAQCVTVFISAYTLIAISVDRYTAIVYPLRPRMTKLRSKLIIALVWLVALVTPLPTALVTQLVPHPCANHTYYCLEQWGRPEQTAYYSMALMILQYFFPLLVLIFTYTRIAVVVWGKETPGEAQDARDQRMAASKRKMIKMMIACVAAFLLCWLPLNLFIVVSEQYPSIYDLSGIGYMWFVCHWLAMSHACYNPLIYFWMNAKFRAGLQALFRCLPATRRRSSCFVSTCNVKKAATSNSNAI